MLITLYNINWVGQDQSPLIKCLYLPSYTYIKRVDEKILIKKYFKNNLF